MKNHYQSAEHRFLEDGPLFASKFWRLGAEGLFEEHSAGDLAYIWQITISRIATQIIAVLSCDRDLVPQFEFFNDVRFFPDHIYVCINKVDLVEVDKEKKIDEVTNKIKEFFETRKIAINDTFITCGETIEGFEDVETYNNQVAEMILEITTKN
ncbi:MAG: hypothetical protein HWN81_21530 [Candidatus Lokiarchaeota archaeon]|nr:hypothetical protein [Candidatus Lokiarchaeota archaeon]